MVGYSHFLQPLVEFWRRAQSEHLTQVLGVVEGSRLVVQHHIVRAGDAHEIVAAGDGQQREQVVHVVLVGFGVICVADVAAHRDAEQLAAEVVLEAGPRDLFAVIQVLGADEADDRVHEERFEAARDGVRAGFERLLIDAVMGARRRGKNPGRFRNT